MQQAFTALQERLVRNGVHARSDLAFEVQHGTVQRTIRFEEASTIQAPNYQPRDILTSQFPVVWLNATPTMVREIINQFGEQGSWSFYRRYNDDEETVCFIWKYAKSGHDTSVYKSCLYTIVKCRIAPTYQEVLQKMPNRLDLLNVEFVYDQAAKITMVIGNSRLTRPDVQSILRDTLPRRSDLYPFKVSNFS